ncbi:lantibiotic dehydratase [Actinacidiphila yeochonensis]|uniref:lantibiotic dehydratase n=1 Tax=Actinacidiphila yeochonensis TaxID=89050 RepID=UPI002244F78F|nr:lantibiotic dehydratase [Actinacidiphila yeochonensis]
MLASPTLDGQLDAYISDAAPVPDKRGRKKERSLLSYLYRTACKTSPFSTFTAVATGEFRPAPAPAPPRPGPAPAPTRTRHRPSTRHRPPARTLTRTGTCPSAGAVPRWGRSGAATPG